jgi:hypothetical protein
MTKRKLPPIPLTKYLADRIKFLSGEVQTLSMMFWQKCESGEILKSELSELLLRLQQAGRELNSALEICEGLEKISKFKIENQN